MPMNFEPSRYELTQKFEPTRHDKFYETNERSMKSSQPVRMKDALHSLKNDLDLMFPSANISSF